MKCSPKFRQVATSRAKTEDAMGRPTCESSLLELPNAKLFVKNRRRQKIRSRRGEQMHFANAGFSRDGCRGRGSSAAPSPTTPSRLPNVHYGNARTRRGMLLSWLGTRTQTPSSSPDPFSCYKMQRRTNEICKVCPKILSHYRGSPHGFGPTSVQFKRVVVPNLSA
jgi:hypothetical protein